MAAYIAEAQWATRYRPIPEVLLVWRSGAAFALKAAVVVSAGFFATSNVLPCDPVALAVAVAFLAQFTNSRQDMWTLLALAVLGSVSSRYDGAVSAVPLDLLVPALVLFVSMCLVGFPKFEGREAQP
jgi:hypothetical protein